MVRAHVRPCATASSRIGRRAKAAPLLPLLLLAGCASASAPVADEDPSDGDRPCWLLGPCPPYERTAYLQGVGSGPTTAEADDVARAELAKRFRVEIEQVRESIRQLHAERGPSGGSSSSRSTRIETATRSQTEALLEDVRIAERWRSDGTYHALAVLERGPAARRMRRELSQLDETIGSLVGDAERAGSPVRALRVLSRAVRLAERVELKRSQLEIVASGDGAFEPSHPLEQLVTRRRERLLGLRLEVVVRGFRPDRLQRAVEGALTGAGLSLAEETSPELRIEGDGEGRATTRRVGGRELAQVSGVLELRIRVPAEGSERERTLRTLRYEAGATATKARKARRLVARRLASGVGEGTEEMPPLAEALERALLKPEPPSGERP